MYVILVHLGNGASLAAVRRREHRHEYGVHAGADRYTLRRPRLASWRAEQMTATQFQDMVNHARSSSRDRSDMRDRSRAKRRMRACQQDGALLLSGADQNASIVRKRICEGLGFLGIELDGTRNAAHAPVISTETAAVTVRVMRTDEERMIARSVVRVLGLGAHGGER
jgi:acetate kinase